MKTETKTVRRFRWTKEGMESAATESWIPALYVLFSDYEALQKQAAASYTHAEAEAHAHDECRAKLATLEAENKNLAACVRAGANAVRDNAQYVHKLEVERDALKAENKDITEQAQAAYKVFKRHDEALSAEVQKLREALENAMIVSGISPLNRQRVFKNLNSTAGEKGAQ